MGEESYITLFSPSDVTAFHIIHASFMLLTQSARFFGLVAPLFYGFEGMHIYVFDIFQEHIGYIN